MFQPWDDILRIEGRLGVQLSIVDRLLRVLVNNDLSCLPGIQAQLDDLVIGHQSKTNLDLEQHINEFQLALDLIQSQKGEGAMNDKLASAIENLQSVLLAANRMERIHVADALLSLSTLVAGLLSTIQTLRNSIYNREGFERDLRDTVAALENELDETRVLLASRAQASQLVDDELNLVLENEESSLGATRQVAAKIASLSDGTELDISKTQHLREQELCHYEVIIGALHSEIAQLKTCREEEAAYTQSELASVNEKYSLAASKVSELDLEILDKQSQIDGHLSSIEDLGKQLALKTKLSEDLTSRVHEFEGHLASAFRKSEEVNGAWSDLGHKMGSLLDELASFASRN
jgi:hypothetical protein